MVGAENVDDAVVETGPDAGAMRLVAHRGVHLREGAERVVGGFVEGQVMRGDFDGRHILVIGEKDHLLGGRDVQHMDALAVAVGECDEAAGRAHGGLGIAPDRMRARIAGDAQGLALLEPVFVLGVEGGAAGDGLEDGANAVIIGNQKAAGGGAHEHLHTGATGQTFEHRQFADILVRAADEEGEIAMHAAGGAGDLVLEGLAA